MPFAVSVDSLRCRLLDVEPRGQELEMWCWAASSQMVVEYFRAHFAQEFPSARGAGLEPESVGQGDQVNSRLPLDRKADCSKKLETTGDYKTCNIGGWPYFYEFNEAAQSTEWSSLRFVLEELGVALRQDGWPRIVDRRLSSAELRELAQGPPDFVQRLYDAEDCALAWPTLTRLLDEECPVVFSWRFSGDVGGHLMVAVGYAVTPPDHRWVVIHDPLPPHTGDAYLVPYEYWVAGPYGRHWRDYWVARPAAGHRIAPSHSIDDLRLGPELARSSFPVTESLPPREPGKLSHELSVADRLLVSRLAEEGLEAVRAIAFGAPGLAQSLAMGGAGGGILGGVLQYFAAGPLADLAGKDPLEVELAPQRVDPDNLELADDFIPIFEVTRKHLLAWDGQSPDSLLTAPREVIWEVLRRDRTTYNFFTTVRVRRFEDTWRLVGLGRQFMGLGLALGQLLADLRRAAEQSTAEFSFTGLVDRLSELGLLEILGKLLPTKELLDYLDDHKPEARGREVVEAGVCRTVELGLDEKEVHEHRTAVQILINQTGEEERKKQEKIFDAVREPVIGIVRKLDQGDPLDSKALREIAQTVDKARGVAYSKRPLAKPKFVVDVMELYQQFISYSDDELVPVYPGSFYRPGQIVPKGDQASVLAQLKKLAQED